MHFNDLRHLCSSTKRVQTDLMTTQYDAGILQQFADDLYARARRIVFTTALLYMLVGFVGSATLTAFIPHAAHASDSPAMGIVIGLTVIALGIGISSGRAKAFQLKLQAQ